MFNTYKSNNISLLIQYLSSIHIMHINNNKNVHGQKIFVIFAASFGWPDDVSLNVLDYEVA